MRIMIVEDEDLLRNGFMKMIGRMDLNCSVVASACNGEEALEQLSHIGVDLLITDIRMPQMDGLQLIQKVSILFPGIRSVILSGYDDFEYAKRALQLNCKDYLLKPPNYTELHELLMKIRDEFEAEQKKTMEDYKKKEILNQNQYVIRNEFLRHVMNRQVIHSPEDLITKADYIGIRLTNGEYHVILLRYDRLAEVKARYDNHDWNLLKYAVHNMAVEITDSTACFYDDQEYLVVFLQTSDIEAATQVCHDLQMKLREYLKLSVSSGISQIHALPCIAEGYNEAKQALKYRMISDEGMVMTYQDASLHQQISIDRYKNQLSALFELEHAQSIIERLKEWNEEIKKAGLNVMSLDAIEKELKIVLLTLLRHLIKEHGGNHRNLDLGKQIEQIETGDSFYEKMLPLFQLLNDMIHQGKRGKIENRTVEQAIQFMRDHFNQNLSLPLISEHIYMNPAYFSVMFKKRTGKGVIEFLTEIRLDAAKKLLMQPELKTYQIAEMTGFNDAAYFSNQFKKYIGVSPQEYRNLNSKR